MSPFSSSYQTGALTNGYAPISQTQYFQKQTLTNVSPAVADVSGDWTGTNAAGGTESTWHWVGAAHINSVTTIVPSSLTITGIGSFNYELTTTTVFSDPTRTTTLYGPASAADYQCYFSVDTPASYAVNAQLNQWATVYLTSVATGMVFQRINIGAQPVIVSMNGVIPAGQYGIRASTGVGPPSGLDDGINYELGSGGFSNFNFSVQVPEPAIALTSTIGLALASARSPRLGSSRTRRATPPR